MSFGPKLEELAEVPPGGTVTASLWLMPGQQDFVQQATAWVEDLDGLTSIELTARGSA